MASTVINLQLTIPSATGLKLWLYPGGGGSLANTGGDDLSVVAGDASGLNYEATVTEALAGDYQGHVGPSAGVVTAGPFPITLADDAGPYEPTDTTQAQCAAALAAYDPPTRAEATSDKDEILTRGSTGPWTTGSGGGGGGGSVSVVTVLASTVQSGQVASPRLVAYEAGAKAYLFTLVDEDGTAIDLSGKTVKLFVDRASGDELFNVAGTVSGDNNNLVTITTTSTHNATPGVYRYSLRNVTDDNEVLAVGSYVVEEAA